MTPLGYSKHAFLARAEKLWNRRDVAPYRKLIAKIMHAKFCLWCHELLITNDPRTQHCSRLCSQQHRRFNEKLVKEEEKEAA